MAAITGPLTPFLQIVHVSDMHVVDARYVNTLRQNWIIQRLLPKKLRKFINDSTAEHNAFAPIKFLEFLPQITTQDRVWTRLPTWFVDTGDLTAFGDEFSLEQGHGWLVQFNAAARASASKLLYGNHDAWPGKLPAFASTAEIHSHRARLRAAWYPATWPDAPLTVPIPGTGSRVELWCMNSVIHERRENTWAFGETRRDRFWQFGPFPPQVDPVLELEREMRGRSGPTPSPALRVLAIHYPIHYPPPRPMAMLSMLNDSAVGKSLRALGKPGLTPLAHLVLSGHTHGLYPELGKLPDTASACQHYPLGNDQCQLVVGSLSQLDRTGSAYPHQCEVLRFYTSPQLGNGVLLERLIAARANGLGDYKFARYRDKQGNWRDSEEILLSF